MRTQIARSVGSGMLTGGRRVGNEDCIFVMREGVVQKCPASARSHTTICTAHSFAPLADGYIIKKGGNLIYETY